MEQTPLVSHADHHCPAPDPPPPPPPPPHHHYPHTDPSQDFASGAPPPYQYQTIDIPPQQPPPGTPVIVVYTSRPSRFAYFVRCIFGVVWLAFAIWILFKFITFPSHHHPSPLYPPRPISNSLAYPANKDDSPKCVQPPALFPSADNGKLDRTWKYISTPAYANASIQRLQGAVRVRTESFDDLGEVGEDSRYEVFSAFAAYLAKTFPLTHEKLRLEKINTHGLLFTWQGSDEKLKPTLLMAHQDVVPVPDDTLDEWTHPPFDAFFDGTFIWGRGANDCKNHLTGILEAVELLVGANFEPKRTLLLAFGFDEEVGGTQGAGHLAPAILERYGPDGLSMIVDEGDGYIEAFGRAFAAPAVTEKGYLNVDIVVRAGGGHSSVPPDHTSIGILAEVISHVESSPSYDPFLSASNPYLSFLTCAREHAREFPPEISSLLDSHIPPPHDDPIAKSHDRLAREASDLGGPMVRYLMQTSQAVDVIRGGSKINMLPESATATINHRINIGDSPSVIKDRLVSITAPIAEKYNLSLIPAWSSSPQSAEDGEAKRGTISLLIPGRYLEVAPVSPTDVSRSTPYKLLAGTIAAVFGHSSEKTGPVVAPALSAGNTDTSFYWALTRHIFRFDPGMVGESDGHGNIHAVNERVSAEHHLKTVKWFWTFLRNADGVEFDL